MDGGVVIVAVVAVVVVVVYHVTIVAIGNGLLKKYWQKGDWSL